MMKLEVISLGLSDTSITLSLKALLAMVIFMSSKTLLDIEAFISCFIYICIYQIAIIIKYSIHISNIISVPLEDFLMNTEETTI